MLSLEKVSKCLDKVQKDPKPCHPDETTRAPKTKSDFGCEPAHTTIMIGISKGLDLPSKPTMSIDAARRLYRVGWVES